MRKKRKGTFYFYISYDDSKKTSKSTPYFNMQFVATDDEMGAATVKLYLCSYDEEGEGFLGSAVECSKNDKKAKDTLKKLVDGKHNVHVLVESINSGAESGDKVFRIVGKY